MARAIADENLDPTPPIDVMFGAYEVGRYRMPYMLSVLSAWQCHDYLSLASDDPELTLQSGKVEELFQRDIDQERVAQMADHYLSPANALQRPPFFNSLTIALLHRGPGERLCPRQAPQDSYSQSLECGPVLVTWDQSNEDNPGLPKLGSFGCVYWNRRGVRAVAIDGQHRLAALQRVAQKSPAEASRIRVSVLILLLDQAFGVRADGRDQIEVMRALFIDLNKHAQRVSRARQLLLDDADPLGVSLRSCVGSELRYRQTDRTCQDLPVGANDEFETRLPLSLVDWHGEQRAKVDAGPYLVSVLGLEWALVNLCKSDRFGKRLVELDNLSENAERIGDIDESEGYYDSVRDKLASWMGDVPELQSEIEQARSREAPFFPSTGAIQKMSRRIAEVWGPAITRLFISTRPYRRLIDNAVQNDLLTGRFSVWYQAKHASEVAAPVARSQLGNRLAELESQLNQSDPGLVTKYKEQLRFIESEIKTISTGGCAPEQHLLFSLTGQRAIFLAMRQIFDMAADRSLSVRALAKETGRIAPADNLSAAALFIAELLGAAVSFWDSQLDGMFFTKVARTDAGTHAAKDRVWPHFWRGSLIKRDSGDNIDFSGIAAERTARVICALWAVRSYRLAHPEAPLKPIEEWLKSGNSSHLRALESTACGAYLKKTLLGFVGLDQFGGGGHDSNKFPLAFLAKLSMDEQSEMTRDDFQRFAAKRVRWIWNLAGTA